MSLLSLPNELIAKILRLVTPALLVPTSASTFLPEILEERGDNKGEWKDIGNLMLVSKKTSTHAAPLFWSHVEVTSENHAGDVSTLLGDNPDLVELVLSVRFCAPPANIDIDLDDLVDAYDSLYYVLDRIEHLSFQGLTSSQLDRLLPALASYARPLVSINRLPLSCDLYPILVMLLNFAKESLLHLSIFSDQIWTSGRGKAELELPNLLSLSVGQGGKDWPDNWLEYYLQSNWTCPSVQKRGLGFESVDPLALHTLLGAPSCVQHAGLSHLLDELSYRQRRGHPQPKEVVIAMPGQGGSGSLPPDAAFHSVERLIVVQEMRDFWNFAQGRVDPVLEAFTRTITLAHFPDLRTVIWVLPKGVTRGTSVWPAPIMAWIWSLKTSSVSFEIV